MRWEKVSKSTASVELHDHSTGKKERSNRAAGIRLCFLAITKTLIKKYKHRSLLACLHCKYFGV